MTPAQSKHKQAMEQAAKQLQQPQQQQRLSTPPQPSVNVAALNLNSAISIIPASTQRKQQQQPQSEKQGQFAVPQNKQPNKTSEMERPPRPPTVDLTQDTPNLPVHQPHMVRRGRPPRFVIWISHFTCFDKLIIIFFLYFRSQLTCQVCDKVFQNQEQLAQHMTMHRAVNKLHYK